MIFMRGWVGDIVFMFDKRGKVLGLMLWREWEDLKGREYFAIRTRLFRVLPRIALQRLRHLLEHLFHRELHPEPPSSISRSTWAATEWISAHFDFKCLAVDARRHIGQT
jgi:hypothetical protein